MALLVPQKITTSGVVPAPVAAAAGGDSFSNTGNEVVHITAGATGCTVTFTAQKNCSHEFLHNVAVVVAANTTVKIGPFRDTNRWNDVNGRVQMTYTQVVTVTVGVFSE